MAVEERLERFKLNERVLHWLYALGFLMLAVTGLFLFLPPASAAAGEGISRIVHRVGAIIYMALPFVYLFMQRRELAALIRDIFLRWDRDDLGWFRAAPPFYFLGAVYAMPPQGKYNTGQRLNIIVQSVGSIVLIVTGLLMWVGRGAIPPVWYQTVLALHDLAAIPVVAFFLVHFYLSGIHPLTRPSFWSMVVGEMPGSFAMEHHPKWYTQVTGRPARRRPPPPPTS